MNILLSRWLLALGLALIVSLAASRARLLSPGGAAAAVVVGTMVFGGAGLPGAGLLLAFFISSSLLTRVVNPRAVEAADKFSKGGRRDAAQVLANGGLAALLAGVILPAAGELSPVVWAAFAGALAAANADTWATEIGVRFGRRPVLITTLAPATPGTSGAVTGAGLAASFGGAGLIAVLSLLGAPGARAPLLLAVLTAAAGSLGALVDSLLGATLQARYRCLACGKVTEQHPQHRCGGLTTLTGGWAVVSNEVVNFDCTAVGAALAGALAVWLA
ncbi:MAG: DUF92 domain-containing protein [Chloroflexi bacterium]|nr:DUF92 domain-containing protein [Chloroflexota bacterium]